MACPYTKPDNECMSSSETFWTESAWTSIPLEIRNFDNMGAMLSDLYLNNRTPGPNQADFYPWGFLKRINQNLAQRKCYSLIGNQDDHGGFGPLIRMLGLTMDWIMQLEFGKRHFPDNYKLSVIPKRETSQEAQARCKKDADIMLRWQQIANQFIRCLAYIQGIDGECIEGFLNALETQQVARHACHMEAAPSLTAEMVESQAPGILENLGLTTCITNDLRYCAGLDTPLGCLGGKLGNSYSRGCEQIMVMCQKIIESTVVNQCLITSISTTIDNSARAIQNINIAVCGIGSQLNCAGNLEVNNRAHIDVTVDNQISNVVKHEMAATIKTSITAAMRSIQDAEKEFMSSPQGQKAVQDAIIAISTCVNSTSIVDIATTIVNEAKACQNINITIRGGGRVSAKECQFTNDVVLKLAAMNLMTNSVEVISTVTRVIDVIVDMEATQKSKAIGPGLGNIIMLIIVLVVIGTVLKAMHTSENTASSPKMKGFFQFNIPAKWHMPLLIGFGVLGVVSLVGIVWRLPNLWKPAVTREEIFEERARREDSEGNPRQPWPAPTINIDTIDRGGSFIQGRPNYQKMAAIMSQGCHNPPRCPCLAPGETCE